MAALSASDAWVFVSRNLSPSPSDPGYALLWHNGTWRSFPLAGGVVINSAVTFSHSA